jgi:para-aminobenzoate synthetase component I
VITKTFDFSRDPFELFHLFRKEANVFFLDSSLAAGTNGRYSFIGFDPFLVMQGTTPEAFLDLKKEFRKFAGPANPKMPFSSGAVGYLSYDLGLRIHGLSSRPADVPLFHFGFYDIILAVDHLDKKLHVISSGFPEQDLSRRNLRAEERAMHICLRLNDYLRTGNSASDHVKTSGEGNIDLKSECSKDEYMSAVKRALEHIRQGDIYEINLSHRITADRANGIPPWRIYQRLRGLSPSHFSAFYDAGTHQLLSSSPERFLSLRGRAAEIRPMKGTRPRGADPVEDRRLREELLKSEKEIAELLMVTDLERNDLGRVCAFGSVKVRDMRVIEEYKTVFQATSTVEGTLRGDCDAFDLIAACFPGGSVTGCPKISAMKIIDELEKGPRGIYTGAFGYLDFSGNLDFNILIRTLLLESGRVSFHVGGGIVADSDPQMEYDETWIKARALVECLTECSRSRS